MATDPKYGPDVVLSVFLKPGRGVYGMFIRQALLDAGFTDMPVNGGYILGLVESGIGVESDITADVGVSRQKAGHLLDSLVIRAYLERSVDPLDGRRVLEITDRGRAASEIVFATVQEVDARLVAAVGSEYVAHTKETLAALVDLWPSTRAPVS